MIGPVSGGHSQSTTVRALDFVAAVGLALGAIFGLAGTLVTSSHLRATLWAIDGVGLVVAAALLAFKFLRKGQDCVAAGFLVFAIAESIILSGTAAELVAGASSFAAGTALWGAALLLISIPKEFPAAGRLLGLASALLFLVTAARSYWIDPLLPTSSPLPFFAYPFLVATFLSWIWALLTADRAPATT